VAGSVFQTNIKTVRQNCSGDANKDMNGKPFLIVFLHEMDSKAVGVGFVLEGFPKMECYNN
jgi:hypothetical protein